MSEPPEKRHFKRGGPGQVVFYNKLPWFVSEQPKNDIKRVVSFVSELSENYTRKNAQVVTNLQQTCYKLLDSTVLLQACSNNLLSSCK